LARPGDEVPDVSLANEDGRPITPQTYRGKILVVTFFFTSCPLPEYRPGMNESFGV
jgi:protein SCO1/2